MRIGKNKVEPQLPETMLSDNMLSNNMEKLKTGSCDLQANLILINLLPVLSMIFAVVPTILLKSNVLSIAKLSILTLILSSALSFYIRINAHSLLNRKNSNYIIIISYLFSISMSLLFREPDVFCFWMIGGLLVSMIIDNKLGLFMHFNISFILGIYLDLQPETVIQLLVIGLLLCILSGSLKQKSTVIYAAIIILSTNITISFIIHNFMINTKIYHNYMSSFFSIIAVLMVTYLFFNQFDRRFTVQSETAATNTDFNTNNQIITAQSILSNQVELSDDVMNIEDSDRIEINNSSIEANEDEQIELTGYIKGLRTSYDLLNDENNILLQKMKDYSISLYQHSIRIGDISSRAAKLIGADESLAKAGGLYHDVGKMKGKYYIEEGLKLAEDYSFSKELKDILKQHNIKYDKPSSVEAAIVMLSDNIHSTIEYITKKDEHRFTPEKIIDNLFHMRMEKGTLDNSGLSVKDYRMLKEFYKQEFAEGNKK